MKHLKPEHALKIKGILNVFAVIASTILIVSLSLEAFGDNPFMGKTIYSEIQLFVCLYYIFDFFILLLLADKKRQFFRRYFFILLIAIPYLSLISDVNLYLSQEQIYFIRLIPLIRGAAALVFIVLILVRHNTTAILISYLIFLASIIYFLTLIFFVVENNVNHSVQTFPDALWWAAMTVTTLGSSILPVTVAGKFITTAMAMVGLTILPIFTAYITTMINGIAQREFAENQALKQSETSKKD
ncbi:potassium channel family protein [Paenochrobactrum pullorum]|uniref:potassium channel family protein n=1 Tax=Paenochrobactrum pullorum TaxID=1324351 RepID=UPI0035BC4937